MPVTTVKVGCNIDKPPRRVIHASLTRVNDDSPFRSWCPICDEGILLVRQGFVDEGNNWHDLPPDDKVAIKRSRADRCTLCGQVFWYTDDVIEGIELWEPANLPIEYAPRLYRDEGPPPFKCPTCGHRHNRGWFDGVEVFRCLNCGYAGKDNAANPLTCWERIMKN